MTRRALQASSRVHIWLYDEDVEFLDELYGKAEGLAGVGRSRAIRELVHSKVLELKAREQREYDRIRATRQAQERGSSK